MRPPEQSRPCALCLAERTLGFMPEIKPLE